MKKILLLVTMAVFSLAAIAQNEDSVFLRRLANEILLNSKAYENLRVLTKTIGGRLAGSPQMVKAEAWGLNAMKAANADAAWLQQCMVPHWVRGGKDEATAEWQESKAGQKTTGSKAKLDVIALGNSVGSMKPLKSEVIEIKDFADLETKKDLVKDKIVFYNYKFDPTFVRTFQAYGDAGRYRREGPSRAAKYGAKAVIVRSISGSTDNNPHTGSTAYNDSLPKIPAIAVGLKDADALSKTLGSAKVNVTLHTHGKFLPDTIGHNVIGELKGSQFPNEYITVGGHLDSWDNCEGAHDDGAG